MKTHLIPSVICAALAFSTDAVQALNVLHVANRDSADYSAFIQAQYPAADATETQPAVPAPNWVHKTGGTTGADTVGGDLDRLVSPSGFNGGTNISLKAYL
jgi:hypothetical protein